LSAAGLEHATIASNPRIKVPVNKRIIYSSGLPIQFQAFFCRGPWVGTEHLRILD
jgi:hypothetical protein